MGINFFKFLKPKNGKISSAKITSEELWEAAQEYQIRELCFWICVNMVANAVARCEFRTFRDNREVFEREYYLWNFEPNINQSSTVFLHKLISSLYKNNEALVIDIQKTDGYDSLFVADSWTQPEKNVTRKNEYKGVNVGDVAFKKTFSESDVLHFQLNNNDMRSVINAMYDSYYRLLEAAIKQYEYNTGQHWKVHVEQSRQGDPDWEKNFISMIQEQFKPFLNSSAAVLPEFSGYTYTDVGTHTGGDTRDIKNMIEDIFDFTARGLLIPAVLVNGKIEGTKDANTRFLTNCIDPLCDQLQEEITRKRYGYDQWRKGNYLRVDSSSIIHFDLFENAVNVEKLVGSGAYTINDVRRAANQSRIEEPWADAHYMTLNIASVNEATRKLETEGGGQA